MPSPVTGGTRGDALSPVDPAQASLLRAVHPVSCLRPSSSVGTSRPAHWAPTPSSVCVSTSLRRQHSSQRLEHTSPESSQSPRHHGVPVQGGWRPTPASLPCGPAAPTCLTAAVTTAPWGCVTDVKGELHVSRNLEWALGQEQLLAGQRRQAGTGPLGPAWPSDAEPGLSAQRAGNRSPLDPEFGVDGKGRPTAAPLPASLASLWAGRCSRQQALSRAMHSLPPSPVCPGGRAWSRS